MCADLLWNAICRFSGVLVADPTFFQDRGQVTTKRGKNTSGPKVNSKVLGDPKSYANSYSNRRRNFRKMPAAAQDVILQGIALKDQTPEDYFGGWTIEQIVNEEVGLEATSVRRAAAFTQVGSTSADTPNSSFANRRVIFRKLDAVKQEIYLKRLTDAGQTPEAYFGGYSLDKVRNPLVFDKDVEPLIRTGRRTRFRAMSDAKQEELLKSIRDLGETPEVYFGEGWSVDRVRSKSTCLISVSIKRNERFTVFTRTRLPPFQVGINLN